MKNASKSWDFFNIFSCYARGKIDETGCGEDFLTSSKGVLQYKKTCLNIVVSTDTNEVSILDIYLLFIIALMCFRVKIHGKDFNENFLSRGCTTCVNGIFALIIFYSHLAGYIYIDMETSANMHAIRDFLGQLMVTSFLFYSGYGIYEQIKKRADYVASIPGKRVAKVWLRMAFSVCLFAIMQRVLGNWFSKKTFLVALTGWDNLGNSNWYIFAVLFLYLLTYGAFTICGDNHKGAIVLLFIGTAIYMMFMDAYKPLWWYDTVMCYPVGVLASYFKSEITQRLFKTKRYLIAWVLTLGAFLAINQCYNNFWRCNLRSVLFVMMIVLASMKIELRSPVLNWFGRNAIWMLELQRIPMIVLQSLGYAQANPNKTALAAFVATVVGVFICEKLFAQVDRLLFGGGKKKVQIAQA